MCLLSYYPPHAMPDREALLAGAEVNGDGAGFAIWLGPGSFWLHTSSDTAEVIEKFARVREGWPEGPALTHLRLTTTAAGDRNLQPFLVKGLGVFAHNGTVHGLASEERSDSLALAQDRLPGLSPAEAAVYLEDLFAGTSNSAALVAADTGMVKLIGRWRYLQNGVWHSNSDYLPPPPPEPGNHDWARLRRFYRELGDRQALGDREAGLLRAAMLARLPELLRSGRRLSDVREEVTAGE